MIKIQSLIKVLNERDINFYTGVPDSILKNLSSYLEKKSKKKHILATNEGSAVSIGIGYHLATKKVACVYMQNSGLSNAINPLISIAHQKVYNIPLVMIIGWRGSPNIDDEPQHQTKGKITKNLLKLLNIDFVVVRSNKDLIKFKKKLNIVKKQNKIIACLIEQGTFQKSIDKNSKNNFKIDKKDFLFFLQKKLKKNDRVISTTGYTSREIIDLKKKNNFLPKSFYMVGGMGHSSSVALGYSLFSKNRTLCLDGDGSLLMHLGSLKSLGKYGDKNLKYVLLNNNSHDSVGGQKTFVDEINFNQLSKSIGFKKFYFIKERKKINQVLNSFLKTKKSSFLEVRIKQVGNKKLPRPENLKNIKKEFMSV